MGTALLQLRDQSFDVTERFEGWVTTGNLDATQMRFAQEVLDNQERIRFRINTAEDHNFSTISNNVSDGTSAIMEFVRDNIVENQPLFSSARNAFNLVINLNQRDHMPQQQLAETTALFNSARQSLLMVGGPQIPADPQAAEPILRNLLISMLPEKMGPYRNDVIQQFKDHRQFDAFTQDLSSHWGMGPIWLNPLPQQQAQAHVQTQSEEEYVQAYLAEAAKGGVYL